MANLKGTKTHENLKHAFAGESQANRRYLYFARVADIEGYPEIGGLFRDTSEAETGHAFGHMDFLKVVGDPATDVPFGSTRQNLQSSIEGETYEYRPRATRASPRSRSGSRRWPRPSAATPAASRRASKG
jgi:rubrerythrin